MKSNVLKMSDYRKPDPVVLPMTFILAYLAICAAMVEMFVGKPQ